MASVHIHLKILYVLWTLIWLVFTQNVKLHDYGQKDANTKCTSGLLLEVDQSGFKTVVTLDKDDETLPFVTFVIKEESSSSYNLLLTLSLRSECVTGHKRDDSVVNCKKINDTEFNITVLTKALSQYSGARVKGYIGTYDPDGKSVQLPHSYEPTAAFGTLSINGQIKSPDMFCNETIDKEELNIKFNCSSSAEPCVAEIYVNDSIVGTPIENGALYNGKVQNGEEVYVTIKYAACRLDGKYNNMTCRINASYIATTDDKDGKSHWSWFALIPALPIVLIGAFVLHRYIKRKQEKNTEMPLDEYIHISSTPNKETEQGIKVGECFPLMEDDTKCNEKNKSMSLTPEQESKLIQAAEHGDFATVSFFIKNEAIDDAMTRDGVTVLMKASEHGHKAIVELLIENGADVNQETADGETAIQLADRNGHVEIVALLKKTIEPDLSEFKLNIKTNPYPNNPRTDSKQGINV